MIPHEWHSFARSCLPQAQETAGAALNSETAPAPLRSPNRFSGAVHGPQIGVHRNMVHQPIERSEQKATKITKILEGRRDPGRQLFFAPFVAFCSILLYSQRASCLRPRPAKWMRHSARREGCANSDHLRPWSVVPPLVSWTGPYRQTVVCATSDTCNGWPHPLLFAHACGDGDGLLTRRIP